MPNKDRLNGSLPPPPRQTRLTKRGRRSRIVVACTFIVVCAIIAGVGGAAYRNEVDMRDHGISTRATVTHKRVDDDDYQVQVVFRIGGVMRTSTLNVNEGRYDKLAIGEAVEVTYRPSAPSEVELGRVTSSTLRDSRNLLAGLMAFYIPLCLFIWWISGRGARREMRFLRDGVLAQARVMNVWRIREGGRVIEYKYTIGAKTYKAKSTVPAYVGASPGQDLPMLYLPTAPRFSMLLDAISLAMSA